MTRPDPVADRIHQAHDDALAFHSTSSDLGIARAYLRHRGIDPARIPDPYWVGYARPGWTRLTDHLTAREYSPDEQIAAGLTTRSRNGTLVDRYRDRLLFPLRTEDQRIAGFTARDLSGHATAKYLNTPTTSTFTKSRLLYGLTESTGYRPVLVEGPLDVLALTSADADLHPVAACGTAFTSHHAALIDALTRRSGIPPVVAFDNDPAGVTAAFRAADTLRSFGTIPDLAALPAGLDPAEHLARGGDTRPFRNPPDGTAVLLPLAYAAHVVAVVHDRMDPDWAETHLAITRAVTTNLATYSPSQLRTIAGPVSAYLRDTAGITPDLFLRALTDSPTATHDSARTIEPFALAR